jgi:hypothetical protein
LPELELRAQLGISPGARRLEDPWWFWGPPHDFFPDSFLAVLGLYAAKHGHVCYESQVSVTFLPFCIKIALLHAVVCSLRPSYRMKPAQSPGWSGLVRSRIHCYMSYPG